MRRSTFLWALAVMWRSGPGLALALFGLLLVQSFLPIASLYLMKRIVETVSAGLILPGRPASLTTLTPLFLASVAVALALQVSGSLAGLVQEAQAQAVSDHVQGLIHRQSWSLSISFYESATFQDKLHDVQHQVFRVNRVLRSIEKVVQEAASVLAMVGILLAFHWTLPIAIALGMIPEAVVRLRHGRMVYHWQRARSTLEREGIYHHWMLTGEATAKEVRAFGLGPLFAGRFHAVRARLRRERLDLEVRRRGAETAAGLVGVAVQFSMYALLCVRTMQGLMSLGDLAVIYQAFQRGQNALRGMVGGLATLHEDRLFVGLLHEFLGLGPTVAEPLHPVPFPRPLRDGITFEHVSFRYEPGGRPVLDEVSLKIRPGEVIALVGENGAGKTTLVKLLCRLYDPTGGRIVIDDIDIAHFSLADLRREVGVIFQDHAHYNLTARENIWIGDVDRPPDDARITEAARASGADAVIGDLPRGYDTVLGKWFADGEELSIGQWQKVALARAFLRDGQVVVLDEPTSALDPDAEFALFQRFRALIADRTAILISHRLSTVRMADCIYVLEQGRVVEKGTHDELLATGGRYADLFEKQASSYR